MPNAEPAPPGATADTAPTAATGATTNAATTVAINTETSAAPTTAATAAVQRGKGKGLRALFVGLGLVCFALGAVGAFVPVLPTTPFLLLASYCFVRGSERFHRWFIGTGLYRRYLAELVEERSLTLAVKAQILAYATIVLLLAFFAMRNPYGRAFVLLALAVKYYYFICKIKTRRPGTPGSAVNPLAACRKSEK